MGTKIAILFGGKSAEFEISLASAKFIGESLDREKFDPIFIGIDKSGLWHLSDENLTFSKGVSPFQGVAFLKDIDVVFPIFHGPFGEDGRFQGFLEVLDLPYVGASTLGSAINMDKEVAKRLLQESGLSTPKFLAFQHPPSFNEVEKSLELPFFVKPANMGSSIGISKVSYREEFDEAVRIAFLYDTKIVIEEGVIGREIECSVLGLDPPIASRPGEVIPQKEFYSYEAKYESTSGTVFLLPVELSPEKEKEVRNLSLKVFKTLCCEGMARVDFFMDREEKLYVNELNTIPGFTAMSVYPKLWQVSGIEGKELVTHLIEIAFARHAKKQRISVEFEKPLATLGAP